MKQLAPSTAIGGDFALIGLVSGIGMGVLNVALLAFFVFPVIAHHVFHTFLHYDARVLGYAASYVGILGVLGALAGLFAVPALMKKREQQTLLRHRD